MMLVVQRQLESLPDVIVQQVTQPKSAGQQPAMTSLSAGNVEQVPPATSLD
jgi:hypothetical protein